MWTYPLPEQCPPFKARKESLSVYRLVETIPTTNKDWLPVIGLNKKPSLNVPHREFSSFENCCAHGLSVYTDLNAIKKTKKKLRAKFKNYKIVKGTINVNDGMILETFEAHHITWWLQTNNPETTFIEVEEDATV